MDRYSPIKLCLRIYFCVVFPITAGESVLQPNPVEPNVEISFSVLLPKEFPQSVVTEELFQHLSGGLPPDMRVNIPVQERDVVRAARLYLPYWLPLPHVFPNESYLGSLPGDPKIGAFDAVREIVESISKGQENNFALQRRVGLFFYDFSLYWKNPNKKLFEPEDAYPYRARAVALPEFEQQSVVIRRELLDGLQDVCARMNRWDKAIVAQQRSVDTAGGSRAVLARLHHRAADFLNTLPPEAPEDTPPDQDESASNADAPLTTAKTADEHLALRDQVLMAALEDLARRDDIIPTARFLAELEREAKRSHSWNAS